MTAYYYRDWLIEFDPKPYACRNFDWTATSPDYDAWTEGDLWTDNGEKVSADSREALEAEIDAWIDDQPHPFRDAFLMRLALPMAFGLAIILTIIGAAA